MPTFSNHAPRRTNLTALDPVHTYPDIFESATFLSGYGFRPHVSSESDSRRIRHNEPHRLSHQKKEILGKSQRSHPWYPVARNIHISLISDHILHLKWWGRHFSRNHIIILKREKSIFSILKTGIQKNVHGLKIAISALLRNTTWMEKPLGLFWLFRPSNADITIHYTTSSITFKYVV